MLRDARFLFLVAVSAISAAAACSSDKDQNATASCVGDACPPPCTGTDCAQNPDGGGTNGEGAAGETSAPPIVCPLAKVNTPTLSDGGAYGGSFGTAIAIDGTLAAVGAPTADDPAGAKGTGTVHAFTREGCTWTHRGATTPTSASRYDEFGGAVALASGQLLVGSTGVKEFTSVGSTVTTLYSVGAAYIAPFSASALPAAASFKKLGGISRENLNFGYAVALAPDAQTAFVGAPGYGYNSGISEVTDMGAVWVLAADKSFAAKDILYGPDKDGTAGSAIALGDNYVLSGAPAFESGAGTVHIYTNNGGTGEGGSAWPRSGAIRPQTLVPNSRFGAAIALAGELAVIGAPTHQEGDAGAAEAGAAYVFRRGNDGSWTEAQKLAPTDLGEKDHFGQSIAIVNGSLVIGAPNQPFDTMKSGAIYVFEKKAEGYAQKAVLRSPETAPGDAFGSAIAAAGNVVLAGAPGAKDGAGALFTFTP